MTAGGKEKRPVTLPEGVSLRRVAEVLLDAWEADPRRWMNAPPQLREGAQPKATMPVPQDAMDLFRLLAERRVDYLLVGGMAMLTYVKGRNTKDVDLLMSVAALEQLPELKIEDRNDFFARGKFKSIQVDLLLTKNPLFKIVAEKFATRHPFAEMAVPAATVEGMILLKLLRCRRFIGRSIWTGSTVYENDIKMLLARYQPEIEPLFQLLEPHMLPSGFERNCKKIVSDEQQRVARMQKRRFQTEMSAAEHSRTQPGHSLLQRAGQFARAHHRPSARRSNRSSCLTRSSLPTIAAGTSRGKSSRNSRRATRASACSGWRSTAARARRASPA